jgi:hypothetical protein
MTKLLYQKQHEEEKWVQDPTLTNKCALQNVTFASNSILMSRGNADLHNKHKTGLQYKSEWKDIRVLHTGVSRDVMLWCLVRQHQESA